MWGAKGHSVCRERGNNGCWAQLNRVMCEDRTFNVVASTVHPYQLSGAIFLLQKTFLRFLWGGLFLCAVEDEQYDYGGLYQMSRTSMFLCHLCMLAS